MPLPILTQPEAGEALAPLLRPEVLAFLAHRRSASAVSLTAPGPNPDELDLLLRLAVRVPDHGKLTPWRLVLLQGDGKARFAARLEEIAVRRGDVRSAAKLVKLKAPPMGVAVISRLHTGDIPEWEQRLSAAVVCVNLLYGATAMGLGANWITDWYAYDAEALAVLGVGEGEKVAGFVFIGTAGEAPLERPRPDPMGLTSVWAEN
ncbi:MAG: nitroreductase [Caulobacteraceae bacterium]|nr:nitroreductase [Caulobacteraceae bacterium]